MSIFYVKQYFFLKILPSALSIIIIKIIKIILPVEEMICSLHTVVSSRIDTLSLKHADQERLFLVI